MSSKLQIEANRRNSQKSTGPRTPAGKAASSLNHTQSGLYAQSQIIIGERQSDLEDLAAAFHSQFQPDSPEQQALLDIAIHSEWILRRLRRAETGLWDSHIDEYGNGDDTHDLGRAFDCRDKTLARLQRRLDSLQRNFQRALKELARLQSARPNPEPQPASQPQPKPADQESIIGFIPPAAAPPLAPPAGFGFESSPSLVPPATSPVCENPGIDDSVPRRHPLPPERLAACRRVDSALCPQGSRPVRGTPPASSGKLPLGHRPPTPPTSPGPN